MATHTNNEQKGGFFKDEEIADVLSSFHSNGKGSNKDGKSSQEDKGTYTNEHSRSSDNFSDRSFENDKEKGQKKDATNNTFSKEEASLSMELMQRLVQLQSTKKQLTSAQKNIILLNTTIKDEHKVILLQMLNDKNPKQTLRSFYKSKDGEMFKNMQQSKAKGKNPLSGVASFVKENSRMQFD